MSQLIMALVAIAVVFLLAMRRASLPVWAAAVTALTFVWQTGLVDGVPAPFLLWSLIGCMPAIALAVLSVPEERRSLVVESEFRAIRNSLTKISETEQQALEACTICFDADLFSVRPVWNRLRAVPPVVLTAKEQAFLDGPTEELCRMIDVWQIRTREREIPEDIWSFVKEKGFLGMLISKQHGGLGFSAQAQSLVLGKISSRSPDVATIVMVPNSLGPGELIEKYGTPEQKS